MQPNKEYKKPGKPKRDNSNLFGSNSNSQKYEETKTIDEPPTFHVTKINRTQGETEKLKQYYRQMQMEFKRDN